MIIFVSPIGIISNEHLFNQCIGNTTLSNVNFLSIILIIITIIKCTRFVFVARFQTFKNQMAFVYKPTKTFWIHLVLSQCIIHISQYITTRMYEQTSLVFILFLATTNRVQLFETIEFNLLNHSYGMLRRRSRHCYYCCYSFYTSISYYRV